MDKQTEAILAACSVSTRAMAKTFFPRRFNKEFTKAVHDPILHRIDNDSNKVCVAAPRGWGKTSIVALALMARYILFRLCGFIVYINKSETAAVMQTDNLKRELVTNQIIKHFFGNVKTKSAAGEMEEQFSRKAWVGYDTLVLPRGAGQQVRGVIFKDDRPGLIVVDDLEDKDKLLNDELRKQDRTWFFADVMEAVPQIHMNWKVVYIDTLKHEDALLQYLLNAPDWDSIRLESCDDNFDSVAPEFVSNEIIAAKWKSAVDAGQEDTFYQEQRNLPISKKSASFKSEYFRYYNLTPDQSVREDKDLGIFDADVQANSEIENVTICDPAKTVNLKSADSAIVNVGIDYACRRLLLRDIVSDKLYPDELYSELFAMADRSGSKVIGVEVTSLNEFIKQPIKNMMFDRGTFYELVWLNARGGMKKEESFQCALMKKLEGQLKMFPRSALWDIMDCLAYIIEMLELGERYFSSISGDPEDSEAEYSQLTYEPPLTSWRIM